MKNVATNNFVHKMFKYTMKIGLNATLNQIIRIKLYFYFTNVIMLKCHVIDLSFKLQTNCL